MRKVWTLVLVASILAQTAFLMRDYVLPWGWRVLKVRDQPRLLRSADLSLGSQATRAIDFITQVIPEQATVLLPPTGAPVRFALERSMQYFFFPRRLIECGSAESQACAEALSAPEVYVLASEGFPAEQAIGGRQFLSAPPTGLSWFSGVYGPGFQMTGDQQATPLLSLLAAGLADLLLLLALALLGGGVLISIRRPWPALELAAMALPIGAGVLTWVLFLLSWAGVRLSLLSAGAAYLLLLGASATLARRLARPGPVVDWPGVRLRRLAIGIDGVLAGSPTVQLLVGVAGAGLFLLAVGLAVGISYRLYDPVQIWSVKGYGISQEGTILAAERWGVHGLAYPLNLPLQVALFHMLDGDLLPGSKLLYPIFGLSLCLALFAFLRRQHVDRLTAGLGALLLGTVPIVFFHSVEGFANLHFTFYLTAGIFWGVWAVQTGAIREQWLAGLLLGLAAWTRPEGVLYSLGVPILLTATARILRWGRVSPAALALPVAAIAGSWFLFDLSGAHLRGSNLDEAVSRAASEVAAGEIDLSGLWTILRVFGRAAFVPFLAMFPAVSATAWGALFPALLLLLLPRLGQLRPRVDPARFALLLQWLFVAATNVAVFYIRSYSKPAFTAFIERTFPRAFLPTAVLMTALAVWISKRAPDPSE
jgi:hypothetical protein